MKRLLTRIPPWLIVALIGVVLVVIGVAQGGFTDTLRKAALVCYECIGIG